MTPLTMALDGAAHDEPGEAAPETGVGDVVGCGPVQHGIPRVASHQVKCLGRLTLPASVRKRSRRLPGDNKEESQDAPASCDTPRSCSTTFSTCSAIGTPSSLP